MYKPQFNILVMAYLLEPAITAEGAKLEWDLHRVGLSMLAEAPAPDASEVTTVLSADIVVELSQWMADEGYSARAYPHSAKRIGCNGKYMRVYLWVRVPEDEEDEEI